MGAQAGVFFFDGRPTDDERRALIARLQPVAPDGVSAVAENGVAMAYAACHTWAGEGFCEQPRRSPTGLVMTWDGRLDNRDDLLLRLGRTVADTSDAAIALSIFEREGVEGLRSLIGDWSLAIWNGRLRTLYLARDYMGVRPLYYCVDDQSIMWSSALGELVVRADRADALDDRFAAGFMALRFSTDVTPYQGIRAVPTASCVQFSPERIETRQRFWTLQPGVVRYRDKRLYEEQLRALWRDAVGARLRVDGTVWAELSGGLDSSSIVCMADALIKDRSVAATAVQPLSHVTVQSPEGDERTFIAEVEERIGVRSEIVGVEEHLGACDIAWDWVTPCVARGVGLASVRRVLDKGGRVVLSGRVGDVVMGCSADNSVAVFDDFARGRVVEALSKIRLWSRASRKPFVEIGRELVRESIRARCAGVPERGLNDAQRAGIDLLTSRLQPIAEDGLSPATLASRVRPSKHRLAMALLGYSLEARLSIPSQPPGVTYTYPYVHRPLIEFVLAIPGEELSAPGATRSLMRRAFAGLVPDRILRRISKGYYPPVVVREMRGSAASLLPAERLRVVQRGWIDASRLEAAISNLVDGGGHTGGEVQRALRLEQWLRSRHRRGPAVIPKGKEVKTNEILNA